MHTVSSTRSKGKTTWRSGHGEKSHQVGTLSGILTVVYFKNQNKAEAETTDEPNCGTYRQTLEENGTVYLLAQVH
jgi:hypothetical protein